MTWMTENFHRHKPKVSNDLSICWPRENQSLSFADLPVATLLLGAGVSSSFSYFIIDSCRSIISVKYVSITEDGYCNEEMGKTAGDYHMSVQLDPY